MEEMTAPKVTVLMPAYNAAKYIGESIQSVLDQTYSDWELLIVNDGSTDNTVEIVESYSDPRIRLLNNPENLRLIKTLNRGLAEARGEFIARLDADDLASPGRLKLQVKALDDDQNLALVGGCSNVIDESGRLIRRGEDTFVPLGADALRWASVFFNPFRHSAVTFRRSVVWGELAGYPEDAKDLEDYALWTKVLERYDAINLPEVLCDYRVHSASVIASADRVGQQSVDPRRVAAAMYYAMNATGAGAPEAFAERWGEVWAQVRFPFSDEFIDFGELRMMMRQLMGFQLNSQGRNAETGAVSAYGDAYN